MSTILVVDDEPGNVALIRRVMESRGHEVAAAADGEAGIEEVHRVRPDVILLDVNMGHLNGFEVCRRLKSDAATRLIPIVMFTGLDDEADRFRGMDAGADEFFHKPFVLDELITRVESLMRYARA